MNVSQVYYGYQGDYRLRVIIAAPPAGLEAEDNGNPASASAPFVATLVDVSGLVIYFSVALAILSGTLL